uniref:Uncharacterized protein n=1 Tax=Picea sitchensis TaxID=3332 RepID=A9NR26_PICSI|nr:unknown [Picea sitchensis]
MADDARMEYIKEMRRNQCRICIKLGLKIINSVFTLSGIVMISYSLWMLKNWYDFERNLLLHGALPRP